MPFDFLKRKKTGDGTGKAAGSTPGTYSAGPRGVPFDGLTEEWRIVGEMLISGRLSDALNKREPIELTRVQWAPVDGSGALSEAPGLKTVDPYDLIAVLASEGTLPPFRVVGTVFLYPGSEPDRLLDRATEMFVPVVDAVAYLGDQALTESMDAVLVNRFYLRGVEQIDRRTGEKHLKLPGAPLGGTSWQDRSR